MLQRSSSRGSPGFKRYPFAKEYINISKIEREQQDGDEGFDVFHYQGPIVFYAITIIVIIQLVQLFNYDVEHIYNLRTSLNSIFLLRDLDVDSKVASSQLLLASITSKNQFQTWLSAVATKAYRPLNGNSELLFQSKTIMLGDSVLIKYDAKETACKAQVPGNKSCIFVTYDDSTKSSEGFI
jgi:hypothetical protein